MGFAPETDRAGAAIAALNKDFSLIKKFHIDFKRKAHPRSFEDAPQKSDCNNDREARLLSCLGIRDDISKCSAAGFAGECDLTVGQCKQGVVFTHTNITARMEFCAALANNNVAGDHGFTTEFFNA
jgi:hypothetical protein